MDPHAIPKQVRLLALNKTETYWEHMANHLDNFDDVVDAIRRTFPWLPVDVIDPAHVPWQKQMSYYSRASIVLTAWGGISMMDFLLPPGSFEIVVLNSALECEDYDVHVRNHIPYLRRFSVCSVGKVEPEVDWRGQWEHLEAATPDVLNTVKSSLRYLSEKTKQFF